MRADDPHGCAEQTVDMDKKSKYKVNIFAVTMLSLMFVFAVTVTAMAHDNGLPDGFVADPDLNRDLNLNKYGVPVHQFKDVLGEESIIMQDIDVLIEDEYADEWDDPEPAPDGVRFRIYNCTTQETEQYAETKDGRLSGIALRRSHAYLITTDDLRYTIFHSWTYRNEESGRSISQLSRELYVWALAAGDEGVSEDGAYDYKTRYDEPDYLTPVRTVTLHYSEDGFSDPSVYSVRIPVTYNGAPAAAVRFVLTSDEGGTVTAETDEEGMLRADLIEDMDYTVHVDDENYGVNVFALAVKDKSEHKGYSEETQQPYVNGRYCYDHTCCQGVNSIALISKEAAEAKKEGTLDSLKTYSGSDGKSHPLTTVRGMDFKNLLLLVRNKDLNVPAALSGEKCEVFDLTLVNPHRWEVCDITDVDIHVTHHLSQSGKVEKLYSVSGDSLAEIPFTQTAEGSIAFDINNMPSGAFAAVFSKESSETKPAPAKPKVVAKVTRFTKLTAWKKGFTVRWKKVSASGYQVQYCTKKSFSKKLRRTKTIKSGKTVKLTVKKLKAKKRYYVRVRSYKVSGKKRIYSKWSPVRSIKTR